MAEFTKTIIVDTTHAEQAGQYYQTIQAAVNYLSNNTTGGVIIVEAGTYSVSSTISVPSNTTIIGRGYVTISVSADVPVFQNTNYNSGVNSRIVISGFTIDINYSSTTYNQSVIDMKRVSNSIIEKITFKVTSSGGVSNGRASVRFEGDASNLCEGNVITQCYVSDFGKYYNSIYYYGHGVYLKTYCKRNVINDNYFRNCQGHIFIEDHSEENIISNNTIYSSPSSGADYEGIHILSSHYNCVEGNTIDGAEAGNHGIRIEQSKGYSVQNNVCKSLPGNGILLDSASVSYPSDFNSVVGNNCHSCTGANGNGIYLNNYCQYNAVNGNNCCNNNVWGIRESEYASGAYKNVIVGNVCYNNTQGQIYKGTYTNTIKADNLET